MHSVVPLPFNQELDSLGFRIKPAPLDNQSSFKAKRSHCSTRQKMLKRGPLSNIIPKSRPGILATLHQLDLVTPRYIKGFGAVISVNRIDVYTSQANLEQYRSKGADSIISFIIKDWKTFGRPRYLQLDNEASFRGSLYHPRTFGKTEQVLPKLWR